MFTLTDRKGTYLNVLAYPVAPGTHFLCAETLWNANVGMEEDDTDPFFGVETPRILSAAEIEAIDSVPRWKDYKYIIFDANRGKIIDFYSPLNTIIGNHWDEPVLGYFDEGGTNENNE